MKQLVMIIFALLWQGDKNVWHLLGIWPNIRKGRLNTIQNYGYLGNSNYVMFQMMVAPSMK